MHAFSTVSPQLVSAPQAAVPGPGGGESCILCTQTEACLHAVLAGELRGTHQACNSLQVSLTVHCHVLLCDCVVW